MVIDADAAALLTDSGPANAAPVMASSAIAEVMIVGRCRAMTAWVSTLSRPGSRRARAPHACSARRALGDGLVDTVAVVSGWDGDVQVDRDADPVLDQQQRHSNGAYEQPTAWLHSSVKLFVQTAAAAHLGSRLLRSCAGALDEDRRIPGTRRAGSGLP